MTVQEFKELRFRPDVYFNVNTFEKELKCIAVDFENYKFGFSRIEFSELNTTEIEWVCCSEVEQVISNITDEQKLDIIINMMCEKELLTKNQITQKSKDWRYVKPRQVIHYLAQKYTKLTLKKIGILTGGFKHCSVNHSIKTVNGYIEWDKVYRNKIDKIEDELIKYLS